MPGLEDKVIYISIILYMVISYIVIRKYRFLLLPSLTVLVLVTPARISCGGIQFFEAKTLYYSSPVNLLDFYVVILFLTLFLQNNHKSPVSHNKLGHLHKPIGRIFYILVYVAIFGIGKMFFTKGNSYKLYIGIEGLTFFYRPILMYHIVLHSVRTREDVRYNLVAFNVGAIYISVIALIKYFESLTLYKHAGYPILYMRATSSGAPAALTAVLISTSILFFMGLLLTSHVKLNRFFYFVAIPLQSLVWLLTGSRMSVLTFPIFVFVFLLMTHRRNRKSRRLALAFFVFMLLGIVFYPKLKSFAPIVFDRLGKVNPLSTDTPNIVGRVELYQKALNHILENPISGLGLNQFSVETPGVTSSAHNIFLHVGAELGILGLLCLLYLIAYPIIRAWKVLSQNQHSNIVLLTIFLAYVASLATSLTDFGFNYYKSFYTFLFLYFILIRATDICSISNFLRKKKNCSSIV